MTDSMQPGPSDSPSSATPPATVPVAASLPPVSPPLTVPAPAPSQMPGQRMVTVNGINWGHVLDFTHLFRGFRLAINPAKLMIALLAILLIYVAGWVFDFCWGGQVYRSELQQYASARPEVYRAARARQVEARSDELSRLLRDDASVTDTAERDRLKNDPGAAYSKLKAAYFERFHKDQEAAKDKREAAEKLAAAPLPAGVTPPPPPVKTLAEVEQDDRKAAADRLFVNMRNLEGTIGVGIFDTFLRYELAQFDALVENTLSIVRMTPVRSPAPADLGGGIEGDSLSVGIVSRDSDRIWRSDTLAGCVANMAVTGPKWLLTGTGPMQWRPADADTWWGWGKMWAYRLVYLGSLFLLVVFSLLLIAFAGASIARLSALELAGIERPPLKDVFLFAFRRLWVFIKAPIMPFAILLAFGLLIAAVSLVGAIPWIGPIIIGGLFFIALAVSFVLMLLLLGVVGGFNLLYPTVAVEGADAFDAMSRSFAYVYSRPWRLLFYTVVSLIYGVLTFLFVSFAVFVMLMLSHKFVGWGMNFFGNNYGDYSGVPALETMWPKPEYLRLDRPINWWAMSWSEWIGARLLHLWVFVLMASIGSYVVSYYYSSHTIIYLLLRRSVDGQGLRDVYVESK